MRNQFFLLTVLAVAFWTGRGDQETDDDVNRGGDFYLDDIAEAGSGDYSSYSATSDDESDWISSSLSSYSPEEVGSGNDDLVDIIQGSLHLNKNFISAYYDPESLAYQQLEKNFTLAMEETFANSPFISHFVSIRVLNFSPGSVEVDFELEMEIIPSLEGNATLLEGFVKKIVADGITYGRFDGLSANSSSLEVKVISSEPLMTTTEGQNNMLEGNGKTTEKGDDDNGSKYRPGPGDKEVDREKKNILDLILGDPIIIAAIVGGVIVILLSVILLFLFVVYRLKKKDEGSYSLDEPAKSKDPTAYWKETKEFYA